MLTPAITASSGVLAGFDQLHGLLQQLMPPLARLLLEITTDFGRDCPSRTRIAGNMAAPTTAARRLKVKLLIFGILSQLSREMIVCHIPTAT